MLVGPEKPSSILDIIREYDLAFVCDAGKGVRDLDARCRSDKPLAPHLTYQRRSDV